ncbi:MAG: YicC family protein [Gammaproteobacteria bacterium]|nr:YicC family protein [Gammaproteobacteria bacterium]
MPLSMTSFARVEFDTAYGRGAWELRSVNHRYAEVFVRLPDDFRSLEGAVRERIAASVKRGKLDCTLRFDAARSAFKALKVNERAVADVVRAVRHVADLLGDDIAINPLDVLRWPGVTEVEEVDLDATTRLVLNGLDDALDQFLDGRKREGDKLKQIMLARLAGVRDQLVVLETRVPEIIDAVRDRYQTRIRDLADGLDESRVEQECALLVQRLDVAEELDRLAAHVDEVARVLELDEPVGRRLDFLMQELNREANTLGSKSAHVDTANASVNLKVLIEQMREQVQNLE